MANPEESSPLLTNQSLPNENPNSQFEMPESPKKPAIDESFGKNFVSNEGWTADGLPLGHGSVVGEPVGRVQWNSSILACLGRNDEFCSSDVEVCLLGSVAPCVLYGSNVERLGGSGTEHFANHCLPYSGLYLLGNSLFGWNLMAPWFSYPSRTAIRRKFNLEGSCEAFSRSCGCCGDIVEDEVQLENWETTCDFMTHFFCHTCSLCQEGRELRRRLPHPGFNSRSVMVMIPPPEQAMGRDGA